MTRTWTRREVQTAGSEVIALSQAEMSRAHLVTGKASRGPSMADVAAVAGVSHQTVSRVLNNKGKVHPDTRERVLEAINQMGYRRNEAARALASNSSRLIGIVTPRFVNFGPATTLLSVQLAANKKGYLVSVATLPQYNSENLRIAVDDFLSLGVAGLIVIVPVEQMAVELEAQQIPVPTLAIASTWLEGPTRIPRVGVDQRPGARAGMQLLKDRGCQTVAHIAGPKDWFDANERKRAWEAGLAEFGLKAGPLLQGDWSAKSGRELALELDIDNLPDAIFVGNDQMALGVLQAFSERGIRMPEDVAIIGFDDEEGSAYSIPALTTIRQDFRRMGREAIEMLTSMIAGNPVEQNMIPATLKVRGSA